MVTDRSLFHLLRVSRLLEAICEDAVGSDAGLRSRQREQSRGGYLNHLKVTRMIPLVRSRDSSALNVIQKTWLKDIVVQLIALCNSTTSWKLFGSDKYRE